MVSAECAASLAVNVKRKFNTDIGIGLTGAAGPDPHDGKPVGTVWIGIALPNAETSKHISYFYQDQEIQTAHGQQDLRSII